MRKALALIILNVFISCHTQNPKSNDRLEIIKTIDEKMIDDIYKNIDTTNFFEDEIKKFNSINNGILLYNLNESTNRGKFTILNFDNPSMSYRLTRKTKTSVLLNENEVTNLLKRTYDLEVGYYFENNNKIGSIYLFFVKRNGRIINKYFANNYPVFLDINNDLTLKTIKEIFDFTYEHSFVR